MSDNATTVFIVAAFFGCIAAVSIANARRDRGVAKHNATEASNRAGVPTTETDTKEN